MQKLLFLSLLAGVSLQAVLIKLPDAETLTQRLQKNDFGHFVEKTNIIKYLAGQKWTPFAVVLRVKLELYNYNEHLKDQALKCTMTKSCPKIIRCILKDYPKSIKELEELNVLPVEGSSEKVG